MIFKILGKNSTGTSLGQSEWLQWNSSNKGKKQFASKISLCLSSVFVVQETQEEILVGGPTSFQGFCLGPGKRQIDQLWGQHRIYFIWVV